MSKELLARAAKIKDAEKPLVALDATAGLGEDSLILAAAGFQVKLFERNPVIHQLLEDAGAETTDVRHIRTVVQEVVVTSINIPIN